MNDDDVPSGVLSTSQAPSLPSVSRPTIPLVPIVKTDIQTCEDAFNGLSAAAQLQMFEQLSLRLSPQPPPTAPSQPSTVSFPMSILRPLSRQPPSPAPPVETSPIATIRSKKKKGKSKSHSESDRSDSDRSMSSYDYVDKKEVRIGKQTYIESVHGDWFQYRASLLEDARSKLSEEEKYTIARTSVKVYGSLQKVSHQQNIPLLRHTLDQVKRATEYRTWIKRIAPIFLISDASATLLNRYFRD